MNFWLSTEDLESKWGFQDGDIFDDLIWDHRHELPRYDIYEKGHLMREHEVLARLVERRLLPLIEGSHEVFRIGTIHNPIRFRDDYNGDPVSVEVTEDEVLEVAREVWKERS